ncbi:MAG: CaiB/BaiF CoA-transferase family protein [Sphingobium sp.]
MSARPLEGIRILEVGAYISAPYATSLLSALGAEVVKVEPPVSGDPFRRGMGAKSAYFVQYNAGKKSIAVNLKDPAGVRLIKALLPRFDAMLENYRPGKLAALGLGADECKAINPNLIYASVSGFGSGGPLRDRPAYDTIGQSISGFYSIMNDRDAPRLTGTCIADMITGLTCATGLVAALLGRERDPERKGMSMETSLYEAMSTLTIDALTQLSETGQTPVRDSRHPQAQNFCLKTADGGAIAIHLSSSQKFWENLARAIGREELIADPLFSTFFSRAENYPALVAIMEQAFRGLSQAELETRLTEADVPFAPVLTAAEVARHPQTEWLQLLGRSNEDMMLVRPPWRFDGERPSRDAPTPQIGEHGREIAAEVLTPEELDRLFGDVRA